MKPVICFQCNSTPKHLILLEEKNINKSPHSNITARLNRSQNHRLIENFVRVTEET